MLTRPSLAQATSAMVQAATGRIDALCGKPAKKIRRHRQPGLFNGGRGRAVECAARCGVVLDRTRGKDIPGRQSPHKATSLLGMADPRDSASRSRGYFPG